MDRNREVRRAMTNGLTRRRHRSNSLRDSPEEDGTVELQETIRLRDRGSGKKDRDRDRERSSRNKRRRGDRLMHGSHRDDGGDDSTEESVNDDEEDEDDDAGGGVGVRMLPPNPASSSSAMSNHHQLTHRKTFPQAKVFRAVTPWKPADEMIGVSVPRKARSASTKRSHECWISGGGVVGEQINRQASTSPVRPGHVPGPISPSSSNISVRKKIKPNGPKHRPPPKTSSKSSSSNQDEIEIEIAEVLYGMMRQPQGPSKQEIMGNESSKFDPNSRDAIKSTSDAKSRVSSPISNSQPAATQSSSMLPQNSNSSPTPLTAVVPKRKKPRPMNYSDENQVNFAARSSPIASTAKPEIDQPDKMEISSSNLEKNTGSVVENGGCSYDLANTQVVPPSSEGRTEPVKPESKSLSDSKPLTEDPVNRDVVAPKEEEANLPKKESEMLNLDDAHEDTMTTKSNQTITGIENHREEKFQIDLMAPPPPQLRSSPERDGEIIFMSTEPKSMGSDVQIDAKPIIKEAEKLMKMGSVEPEEKKATAVVEVAESHKVNHLVNKERFVDLQMDIKKNEKDIGTSTVGGNKLHQHVPKHQQPQPNSRRDEPNNEKTAQSTGLPLPMSVANWAGGLPPMGYMGPLQGVVSMDANPVPSAAIQPPQLLFSQPRPKRCATHCYIARNICYHQQFTRMGSFWPAPAGSAASLYGPKPSNLNVAPSTELHGNIPVRGVSSVQDKGQGLAIFPGHTSKERVSQAANIVDAAQRKQILLQQAIPPGAPSNILHGPAFIFPLSQQHAAAAASARPGSVKSPPVTGTTTSSSTPNSAPVSASATPAGPVTAMSFNYPNLSASETQYFAAILQSNAYPFPIPAHVGAPPPAYRGTHPQAMPFFNGSFYSSQMLHPSQLQQQQQQQHQQPSQTQQIQQGHQNTSISSGSSSSQKHLQNNQQRPLGSGINGGSGSLQNFPAPKNRPTQSLLQPHQQQNQHIPLPHQARQLESDVGGEDSPSTADSRVSRPNMSFYGQNFAMPMHPQNFALMSPPVSLGGASGTASSGAGANHSEKKQQQPQQQGFKGGVETLPPQAFPMSFASINGATTPGLDISSMAQNHAILQTFPDATTRHGYNQIMAAAVAAQAQQKKNYRISEEGKNGGGDSTNVDEERKAVTVKGSVSVGQSIAFSRPDSTDAPVSTIPGSTVIDSSARNLNMGSAPSRTSGSGMPASMNNVNSPNSQLQQQQRQQQHHQQQHLQQQQQQQQHQQQQQMIQLQKHQFANAAAAASRNKTPASSNGSVYSDHLPSSSSMAAKFPNALSAFPQNLVQSSNSSPTHSPQWKNTGRTTTSQVPPSLASQNTSSLKSLPQQQTRTQQTHTQISFGGNSKSLTAPQGQQQAPSNNQSPSSPMVGGSPTTSISKSAGGSPRTTTSASTGNKANQASALSSQQGKSSPSVTRKSSPVGGRNAPSILGNPHTSSSSGGKPQLPQQQQQQHQHQLSKQAMQQVQAQQLLYSNAYMQHQAQVQAQNSSGTTGSATTGYYLQNQRRRLEHQHQQQQQQQQQGSPAASSGGMLSMSNPATLTNSNTSDPAKVVAAAMKGGLPSQGILHSTQFSTSQSSGNPHQLMPAGFPYVHAVPAVVQVKPTEQKQPAGE